jgi:hypothetical protein
MFNSIKNKLGMGMYDSMDEMEDDVAFDSMESPEAMEDIDPDIVLNDPSSSIEEKKMAIQMIKDRYLKPQE